jgi:transposase
MVILVAGLVFLAVCLVGLAASGHPAGFWGFAFPISILTAVLGVAFYGLTRLLLAVEANTYHIEETLGRLLRHIDQVTEGINALNENILLSEDAKAIAFRDKDLQALRQAIEEEIATKDWEAALYLADQMEKRFGYRQEADHFRRHIQEVRDKYHQDALAMAMARFEDHLNAYEWELAAQDIADLQRDFPQAVQAEALHEKLDLAKTERKKWLIQQWDQAVQRNEVDRGIEIVKELDKFLTPSEVAAFEESARGVFRAKLHNLGVQFSLLVAEKIWDRALEVAEEIIREFPNSRMAQEVSGTLAALKSRSQGMKQGNK